VFSHKHNKWHQFKFDRAFSEGATQGDVYAETQPLIRSVLDGAQTVGEGGVPAWLVECAADWLSG
jgi:hypothetical protein